MSETTTRVTDAMWEEIERLLVLVDQPNRRGRKRAPQRTVAEALAHYLATGCRWNYLPPQYGDDSTANRTALRWKRLGVYDAIVDVLQRAGVLGATRGVQR